MSIRCGAVFPAGGSSSRFGSNKLFEILSGLPVFIRSIRPFLEIARPEDLVIAANPAFSDRLRELLAEFLPEAAESIVITPGGNTRTQSVLNGLKCLNPAVKLVAVHDAARPLVSADDVLRTYTAAEKYGAAALCRPVTDTVKALAPDGFMTMDAPDREFLRAISTPQTFKREILSTALLRADAEKCSLTDDTAAVEKYTGIRAFPVSETAANPKITYPEDLELAEALLSLRGGK